MANRSILIKGFDDVKKFVQDWAPTYAYTQEKKYTNNIDKALSSWENFRLLFEWKNGTGDVIYEKKLKVVEGHYSKASTLKELQNNFDWKKFEDEFEPEKNGTIWKIFLLHLVDPNSFPIFDQHVLRFYNFLKHEKIDETPSKPSELYNIYKYEYRDWFNGIREEHQLYHRDMDKAFVRFGQILGALKSLPIQII